MDAHRATNEDGSIRLVSGEDQPLFSIIIAGDLCPMGRSEELLSTQPAEQLFPGISPILQRADLAIANLECPLTRQTTPIIKSGPHLRARPECAQGVRAAGFSAVSLANNHILDMGEGGLADTLAACAAAGLKTVGAGENLARASEALLVEVNGLRVAVLAFAEHEFSIATDSSAGAAPLDLVENYHAIQNARRQTDFVLVIVHGGNEFYSLPSPRMAKTCRFLVEAGANAVICHHTHVSSGWELYRGTPIVYGTGNFLFEWPFPRPAEWHMGYMVKIGVNQDSVTELALIPYWQSRESVGLRLMLEAEAQHFWGQLIQLSNVIADERRLTEAWDRFCQSQYRQYWGMLFSLSRVERFLLKRGIWPFWRGGRREATTLLNLVTCESHLEVANSVLRSLVCKREFGK